MRTLHHIFLSLLIIVSLLIVPSLLCAQNTKVPVKHLSPAEIGKDTLHSEDITLIGTTLKQHTDSSRTALGKAGDKRRKRNWSTWKPETRRALWLSLVLPGAGQIYNRME